MRAFEDLRDTESLKPTIWSVSVRWFDIAFIDNEHPKGQYNTISFGYFPSLASEDVIRSNAKKEFADYLISKEKTQTKDFEVTVENKGNHRWWLTWFSHETNQELSKDEAFADFQEFVDEKRFERWDLVPDGEKNDVFIWCPMGAEDTWRWRACECDECKESDYIKRIIH